MRQVETRFGLAVTDMQVTVRCVRTRRDLVWYGGRGIARPVQEGRVESGLGKAVQERKAELGFGAERYVLAVLERRVLLR